MIAEVADGLSYGLSIGLLVVVAMVFASFLCGIVQVSTQVKDTSIYFAGKFITLILLIYFSFDVFWRDLIELAIKSWT